MHRTRILLILLLVIALGLGTLKLFYTPPHNDSAPILTPTTAVSTPTPPLPTKNPLLSYSNSHHPFSFTYPSTWTLKSQNPKPNELSRFSLLAPISSPSAQPAQFDFHITLASRSAGVPSISCPAESETCQVQTINQVEYQLTATENNDQSVTISYHAIYGPYLMSITSRLVSDQAKSILSTWQSITQTFVFSPLPTSE